MCNFCMQSIKCERCKLDTVNNLFLHEHWGKSLNLCFSCNLLQQLSSHISLETEYNGVGIINYIIILRG